MNQRFGILRNHDEWLFGLGRDEVPNFCLPAVT